MNQWATFSSYSHFGRQQQSQKEVCASIKCLQKNFTLDNELGCQTRQIIERPEEQCHKQIHHIRKVSAWLGSCIMINGETPLAKMLGRNVWITWQQHLSNILASGVSPLIITAFLLSGQSFHAVLLTNETWYQQRTHGKLENSISLQNPAMMCNLWCVTCWFTDKTHFFLFQGSQSHDNLVILRDDTMYKKAPRVDST